MRFLNYNQMDSIPGLEGQLNLITRPELRVPPRSIVRFTNVEIILSPYIESDFLLDGVIGADGTAPRNFRIYIPKTGCVRLWPEPCAKTPIRRCC